MPTKPIKRSVLKETEKAYRETGSYSAAASKLGVDESTVRRRLQGKTGVEGDHPRPGAVLPALASGELPIEVVLEHLTQASDQRLAAAAARRWVNIRITDPKPIAFAWIGDPHIDDNGCALRTLREHVEIIRSTPGLYAIGLGDYNNNWMGRLAKLWAMQDTSSKTAWRLVEWFIEQLGDKLLLLIKGNHNLWSGSGDPLDFLRTPGTVMADWKVRINFGLPNGTSFKAVAAHDFPGSSQMNPLHGPAKEAKLKNVEADFYIAGHRHNWSLAQLEDGNLEKSYWLARARGYKLLDEYAEVCGFDNQRNGASIVSVIDPAEEGVNRVQCFADLAAGAKYLTYLRGDDG